MPADTGTTLADELERLQAVSRLPLRVSRPSDLALSPEVDVLAQSFLAEALRNVAKHAEATRIDVELERDADTLSLQVRNDGLRPGPRGAGMGLRLASYEACNRAGWSSSGRVPTVAGARGWWFPLSQVGVP